MELLLYGQKWCARKVQYLLFELFKAFERLRAVKNRIIISPKRPSFLYACATCSELPSGIGIGTFIKSI